MKVHDLVIRNGTGVSTTDRTACDIGIPDGKISELGRGLTGRDTIDATGKPNLSSGLS
jgi:dihydroorotase-like cyclic amidohydrolase